MNTAGWATDQGGLSPTATEVVCVCVPLETSHVHLSLMVTVILPEYVLGLWTTFVISNIGPRILVPKKMKEQSVTLCFRTFLKSNFTQTDGCSEFTLFTWANCSFIKQMFNNQDLIIVS